MTKRLSLTDIDGEVRELTAEDFKHFKSTTEALPADLLAVLPKRGRPASETPKQAVNIRLALISWRRFALPARAGKPA